MERKIKFRRPFFKDNTKEFSHFSYWGVKIDDAEFTSPGYNNFCTHKEDQQFVGLKDKTGKEIYNGDILLTLNKRKTIKHYYKVVFETTNCAFSALGINDPLGLGIDYDVLPIVVNSYSGAEVVGNVHENPELLK